MSKWTEFEANLKARYDVCEDASATPSSILLAVLNAVADVNAAPEASGADYVMVPREPTPEMMRAADVAVNGGTYEVYPEEVSAAWAAMLAAAPLNPAPPTSGVDWRGHYIEVTAMRYMDNGLHREAALKAAEREAASMEARTGTLQTATPADESGWREVGIDVKEVKKIIAKYVGRTSRIYLYIANDLAKAHHATLCSPTEKVRSLFERCASTLVGAEYAQGYREALDHVDAARRARGESNG